MVSKALHPSVHILGERIVPCFLKDVFIHKRIAVEALKCGANADEVVTTLLEGAFDAHIHRIEVTGQHGVSTEVAKIAPDVGHAIIGIGAFPHGLSFTVVIKHDVSVFRHGGDVSLDAVVDFPILTFVPEQPRHLKPLGLGVCSFERLIDLTTHTSKVFRFPARRNEFIEDVNSINMVGAIELGLFVDEFLLDLRIQRVERVKKLAPADTVKTSPITQGSQWCVGIKSCYARRYMTCKARQHRLHIQFTLSSHDFLL